MAERNNADALNELLYGVDDVSGIKQQLDKKVDTDAFNQYHQEYVKPNIEEKAPLESPNLTGEPTAPTPTKDDDSKRVANTEYVSDIIRNFVTDHLDEIVNAISSTYLEKTDANNTYLTQSTAESTYAKKSDLKDIDLSEYAKKTDVPSLANCAQYNVRTNGSTLYANKIVSHSQNGTTPEIALVPGSTADTFIIRLFCARLDCSNVHQLKIAGKEIDLAKFATDYAKS